MTQRIETTGLRIQDLPFVGKFSLRTRTEDLPGLSKTLGIDLSQKIGEMSQAGTRRAICLGPDEWMIHCAEAERAEITAASEALYEAVPHSLVDISFREIGIEISGPEAATLISMSCARDLSKLTEGRAARTLFDSAQVILLRESEDRFHMYVWRSFYPHVRQLLSVGKTELAIGL